MSSYIKQRRKRYYLNLHIPEHLWPHYRKRKHEQSLGTSDLRVAESEAAKLVGRYRLEFEALSGNEEAQRVHEICSYKEARDMILSLPAEDAELVVDIEDDKLDRPYTAREESRLKGLYDGLALRQNKIPSHRTEFEPALKGLTPQWLDLWEQSEERKPSNTLSQYRATLRLFGEFAGDRKTREITQQDAAEFLNLLQRLPANHGRGELQGVPIRQAVERNSGPGLSPTTIKRHFGTLKMFWTWAKQNGFASGDDPFDIKLPKVKKKPHLPWSLDDLKALFVAPPRRRDVYEGFSLALFSGMRCSEIADLTWGQLKREAGVDYMQVADAKTEAGNRRVPIHSALSWLLDKQREGDADPIFPKLTPEGPRKSRGGDLSKLFGAWKRATGFSSHRYTFHSARKNVTQIMEHNRVPENEWARVVGHEVGFTYGTYNPAGLTMKRMQEIIELIEYPGVGPQPPAEVYGDQPKLSKSDRREALKERAGA